jgi:peptidoglycan/xylan/chitin deacetylase (PgdA/CDA1 family)
MSGLLYKPVVDMYRLSRGCKKPIWPENKKFAVCITHDVDSVSLNNYRHAWRNRRSIYAADKKAFNFIKWYIGFIKDVWIGRARFSNNDPIYCYDKWIDIERKHNAKSTFLFFAEQIENRHVADCVYRFRDMVKFNGKRMSVAEMIRAIDKMGWEIGLHASWHAYNNAKDLIFQKKQIEGIVGHEIFSIRQHYLHHNISVTPHAQSHAGFKYDSTLGFNNNVGFRFGTCYPWWLYDNYAKKELSIMEIPLIVQDGALISKDKGLRLDGDTAFIYIKNIISEVQKVGGVFTLLWHADHINRIESLDLYTRLLDYLGEMNPWFATLEDIGKWWSEHNSDLSKI